MKLSKYFTFDELTTTSHTDLIQRNNIEANEFTQSLTTLAQDILDPMRDKYGPIIISSGFRGPSLNARVGGSKTSQHCVGQAADCQRPDWTWEKLDEVVNWLKKESGLRFGQVIREKHGAACWLHISTGEKCEALDFIDGTYTVRT